MGLLCVCLHARVCTCVHAWSLYMLLLRVIVLILIASSCGHSDIVKLLIANNADTALKDIDDNDALSVANDDITRLAFNQDVH